VVAYAASAAQTPVPSPEKGKKKAKEMAPPDVGVLRVPTATVDTLLSDAEEFLCKVDPKLKGLIEKHKCKVFSPEGLREVVDPFTALASGIMGQQVGLNCNGCILIIKLEAIHLYMRGFGCSD